MSSRRTNTLLCIFKGVFIAALLTLIGMLLIALITVFFRISDRTLALLNQLLKLLAIFFGVRACVGRGGSRGFVTGTTITLIYMIVGYALYVALGGGAYTVSGMLGEMLMGAAVGAVIGSIFANLKPKKKRYATKK